MKTTAGVCVEDAGEEIEVGMVVEVVVRGVVAVVDGGGVVVVDVVGGVEVDVGAAAEVVLCIVCPPLTYAVHLRSVQQLS
jgi:hypothetical protein